MSTDENEKFMRRAIELSRQAISEPGAKPFAAVVVRDGKIIGEGINRADALFDPTSHGEVEAVRDACRREETLDLEGAALYTTCEPCALCISTMRTANIGRLYYASTIRSASGVLAQIAPDLTELIASLRVEAGKSAMDGEMPSAQVLGDEGDAVLAEWSRGGSAKL